MATSKETSAAIADVYAAALLEVANERGQTDTVAEQFADLVVYMQKDTEFATFVAAPSVDDEKRRATLERLFRGRLNDVLLDTLQVLNRKGRAGLVEAVEACFRTRLQTQRGQVEVDVRTAVPLSDDLHRMLQASLSQQLSREALLRCRVDDRLVGGLIVQVGDQCFDASITRQLATLHRQLMDRVSIELRRGHHYAE